MNKIEKQKSIELIKNILDLKTPLFSIKIGDKNNNQKYELYANGNCIFTKSGKPKETTFVINYYRNALSIACALPAKTSTILKESELSIFLASYFANKDSKKGK